jgi:prepilin-type N-terminal cleavage/methylation domain-containing protein
MEQYIKMKLYLNKTGFTLMEISIAMAIFLTVVLLAGDFIIKGFRSTTFGSEQETAIQNARRGMEIMTKEIRGANDSERGDYPLSTVENDDFVYYSDIDDDGQMERVRYFLDDTLLKKVTTPPGPADDYNMLSATTTIAEYVNNQAEAIFTYYDNNYIETGDLDSIRLINIKLKINVTPERAPNDYYVETDVNLRNLKDNL